MLGDVTSDNESQVGGGNSSFRFIGSNDQGLNGNSTTVGVGKLPTISIQKSGGTLTLKNIITIGGSASWSYTSGTIDPGASSVVFYYNNQIKNSFTFFNVEFQGNGGRFLFYGDITVTGDLALSGKSSLVLDSNKIFVEGNISDDNIYNSRGNGGKTTIVLSGSNDQTLQSSATSFDVGSLPNLKIDKSGGGVTVLGKVSIAGNFTNNYSNQYIDAKAAELFFYKNSTTVYIDGDSSTAIGSLILGGTSTSTLNLSHYGGLKVKTLFSFEGASATYLDGHSILIEGDMENNNSNGSTSIGNRRVIMVGDADQTISGSYDFKITQLEMKKNGGAVTLATGLTITDTLWLGVGNIITTSSHLLTFTDNARLGGNGIAPPAGNNNSYIDGPVKKIGNDVFLFATGKSGVYSPISISAPSSTSDVFVAEYFNEANSLTVFNSPLTYIDPCEYWNLLHSTGSANVSVTLRWDDPCFHIASLSYFDIACDSSSKWVKPLGTFTTTGNTTTGTITSNTSRSSWGDVTLAKTNALIAINAGRDTSICNGQPLVLGASPTASGGTSTKTYSWSPSVGLSSSTVANPTAGSLLDSVNYVLTVTDAIGEYTVDTLHVYVADTLVADAGFESSICSGQSLYIGNEQSFTGGEIPVTYDWKILGSSTFATEPNPEVTPTDTTTYILQVNDNAGCIVKDTVTVKVNPQAIVNAGRDTSIVIGQSVTLGGSPTVSNGSSPLEYYWSPSDGLSSQTTANPLCSPTATNLYYLQVNDGGGCGAVSTMAVTLVFPNLGFSQSFTVIAHDSIITLDTINVSEGKSGTKNFISNKFISRDSILLNTSVVNKALVDLDTAMDVIKRMGGTSLSDLSDYDTLYSGKYHISGDAHIFDKLYLMGSDTSYFIINIDDSLVMSKKAKLILGDNVDAGQVYINVGGYVQLKDSIDISGNLLAQHIISLKHFNGEIRLLSFEKIIFRNKESLDAGPGEKSLSAVAYPVYLGSISHSIYSDYLGLNTSNTNSELTNPLAVNGWSNQAIQRIVPQMNIRMLTYLDNGQASDQMDWNTGWDVPKYPRIYHDLYLAGVASAPLNDAASSLNFNNYYDCYSPGSKYIFPPLTSSGQDFRGVALKLTDYKTIVDGNKINPMYQMNIKSSNRDYNMLELKFASQLQIPIDNILLGWEYYLPDETSPDGNICFFHSAKDFLKVANQYLDYIHDSGNGLIDTHVGITVSQGNHSDDESGNPDCRVSTWNALMGLPDNDGASPPSNQNVLHLKTGDALCFHVWGKSNMTFGTSLNNYMPDISQGTQFLKKALDATRDFMALDLKYTPTSPYGVEVWITDFDMNERGPLAIHGTWADGLYMGLMSLCFLEDERITHIFPANFLGEAPHHAFFKNIYGMHSSIGFQDPPLATVVDYINFPTALYIKTTQFKKTVHGEITEIISRAMSEAIQASNLSFPISDNLYGWLFTGASGFQNQIIVINMGNTKQNITKSSLSVSSILNITSGETLAFDQFYAPNDPFLTTPTLNPFGYVIGNGKETFWKNSPPQYYPPQPIPHAQGPYYFGNQPTFITLPAFSITRIYTVKTTYTVSTNKNEICRNGTANIHASGAGYYTWTCPPGSAANLSIVSGDGSNVAFNPLGSTGTYTITCNAYYANGIPQPGSPQQVTVSVIDSPLVTAGSTSPTNANCFYTLTSTNAASGFSSFHNWWAPGYGLYTTASSLGTPTIEGTTVYAKPVDDMNDIGAMNHYLLTGIATHTASGNVCYSRQKITTVTVNTIAARLYKAGNNNQVTAICNQVTPPDYYWRAYFNAQHVTTGTVTWYQIETGNSYSGIDLHFTINNCGGAADCAPMPSHTTHWIISYAPGGSNCPIQQELTLKVEPEAEATVSRTEYCLNEVTTGSGNNILISANNDANYGYSWSPGSATTSSFTFQPTILDLGPNAYSVIVTQNGNPCFGSTNSDHVSFTVVNPTGTFGYSPATPGVVVGNSQIITITGTTTSFVFAWEPGVGLDQVTGTSIVVSPTVSITYTVLANNINTGTSPYGCCTSFEIPVDVIDPSCPHCQNFTACLPTHFYLTVPFNAANSYQWYRNATVISASGYGATTNSFDVGLYVSTNYLDGDYTCHIIGPNGFTASSDPVANVSAFTASCRFEDTSSSNIKNRNDISVYPNPSKGTFQLIAGNYEGNDVTIDVFNILGTLVYQKEIKSFSGLANLAIGNTRRGIFYLRIHDSKNSSTVKLIINEE